MPVGAEARNGQLEVVIVSMGVGAVAVLHSGVARRRHGPVDAFIIMLWVIGLLVLLQLDDDCLCSRG